MKTIVKTLATVALIAGLGACTGVDEKARADAAAALSASAAAQQAAAAAQASAEKVERLFNKHLRK
ncbi:MAG: hypothetical protein WCJ64_16140 [Rhodospirillaceae bacterium]